MAASTARPEGLRPAPNDSVEIRDDPAKGRGLYAHVAIAAGTLIEAAPVVVVPPAQVPLIDRTTLHDYYFRWDNGSDPDGPAAIALGLVSLCNHTRRPNARVRRNHARETLDLVALAPIAAGEEITIDYNCRLWFEARE